MGRGCSRATVPPAECGWHIWVLIDSCPAHDAVKDSINSVIEIPDAVKCEKFDEMPQWYWHF